MWRLTVNVTTEKVYSDQTMEVTDTVVLEFSGIGDALDYMVTTEKFAVGKVKYEIEFVAKEGDVEC